MKIWANCIVNNEENFIWFSIMSVVDFVDQILVYDTGSTDKTVEIIKEIKRLKGDKIVFKEIGKVDKQQFTKARQEMLDKSDCDWVLIVDGDEIWWEESIKKIVENIKLIGDNLDAIVVPFYNSVGDIYHYQSSFAGQYRLLGKKGHLTIKAVNRKISGLHWAKPYGKEGLFDKENMPIQDKSTNRLTFLNLPFLHLTHLDRSSVKNSKFKYDLGINFPKNFKYPEILSQPGPKGLPSLWRKRGLNYVLISYLKYPFTYVWRNLKKN